MNELTIITKAAAKAQGLKHYFTGEPCKRGHQAERFVSTGSCCECNRETSREVQRVKYADDKARRHPPVQKEPLKAKAAKVRSPEQIERMRLKAYKKACRDEAEAQGLTHYFTGIPCKNGHVAKRQVRNTECMDCKNAGKLVYHDKKPHMNALNNIRKSHPKAVIKLARAEADAVWKIYLQRDAMTEATGILHHVDHIWPLSRHGVHHPLNLQVLPARENELKGAEADLSDPVVQQGVFCTMFMIEKEKRRGP